MDAKKQLTIGVLFPRSSLMRDCLSAYLYEAGKDGNPYAYRPFQVVFSGGGRPAIDEKQLSAQGKVDYIFFEAPEDANKSETVDLVRQIHRVTTAKIIVFGSETDELFLARCVCEGAFAYFFTGQGTEELLKMLDLAEEDNVPSRVLRSALKAGLSSGGKRVGADLTSRELEVANLIKEGLSNKQIAFRLHISLYTVKNHVHSLLKKLDAKGRRQLPRDP